MNKSIILATFAICLCFTSCIKVWDCECTDSETGETYVESYGPMRKKEAKQACTIGTTDQCSIK